MKQNPITEATQEEHGATPPTAQEILDFIRDSGAIGGGAETFVKVLEFSQMQGSVSSGLKAFDIYHESSGNAVNVVAPTGSSVNVTADPDTEDELLAEDLANDLDAAIRHQASWGGLPFRITRNSADATPGYAIWDDRTNVIYLVRNMPGSGISWQYVRAAVEHVGDYLHELNNNYNADNDSLITAIEHITQDDNAENPEMYQLLVSFLPRRLWPSVTAPAPVANQGQGGQHAADDDDVIDVTPEEPEAQDASPAAEEPEQHEADPGETPEQSAPEQGADGTGGYESVNGIKFAGEWNKTEDGQPGDTFSVMFGPWPISQFKQRMQAFPSNALQALFDKPVKYKELANSEYMGVRVFGNASGALKAYTDVCRNYMFFVFNKRTDLRWGMTRKGHKIFFKWDQGPTPSDMWFKLSGEGNGNDFIGFFYGRCRAEVRAATAAPREVQLTPIWDAANAATAATSSTSRQSAKATDPTKPMTANERRKFIEEAIYKRLLDELGQAPNGKGTADDYVKVPIVKASNPQQILVGTPKHHKSWFTPTACRNLARNYDDWTWPARNQNYSSYALRQRIARLAQKLDRLLDPTGIEPPPPKEVIKLEPEEQKKLDQAMAAVNGKLKGTGIEAQVTVPGHKPQYNWIQELGSKQGEGWPKDDKRYFVVMFTGLDTAKVFGDEARTWLQKMRLLKYVQPAFDAAKEVYPEIQWAVVSDNGLPK